MSIGAHPGFNDIENFGRKKINLTKQDLSKLIIDQLELIEKIAAKYTLKLSHVKIHGALSNMACTNLDVSLTIASTIKEFKNDLIYVVLPITKMEIAAKKMNLKYACEIFADRNYKDNGELISRSKPNAIITDPKICLKNVTDMLNSSSIISLKKKKIKCNIDTICIHGDNINAVNIAKLIKKKLKIKGFNFLNLNNMTKFK